MTKIETRSTAEDAREIRAHVEALFAAYRDQDRETIRRGHTRDWKGFQIKSRELVRGIERYMQAADDVLRTLQARRWEFLEFEVEVHGDVATVFYLAREWLADERGVERVVLLRSVDLYRRENGGWNQWGSHIAALPESPSPRAVLSPAARAELLAVRESVWRAFFANDQAKLAELLPEDTIAINAGSEAWLDRAGCLAAAEQLAASGAKARSLTFGRTDIQSFGDVAVLYTSYGYELHTAGSRELCAGRGTEIFVRENGAWRNAGWHLDSGR